MLKKSWVSFSRSSVWGSKPLTTKNISIITVPGIGGGGEICTELLNKLASAGKFCSTIDLILRSFEYRSGTLHGGVRMMIHVSCNSRIEITELRSLA